MAFIKWDDPFVQYQGKTLALFYPCANMRGIFEQLTQMKIVKVISGTSPEKIKVKDWNEGDWNRVPLAVWLVEPISNKFLFLNYKDFVELTGQILTPSSTGG